MGPKKKKVYFKIQKKNVPPNPKPTKIADNPPLGEDITKPIIGIKGTLDNYNKTVDRMANNLVRLVPHLTPLDLVEPSNLGNNEKEKMYKAPMQDPRDFVTHEPGSVPETPEETSFLGKSSSFMGWAKEKAKMGAKYAGSLGLSAGKFVGRHTWDLAKKAGSGSWGFAKKAGSGTWGLGKRGAVFAGNYIGKELGYQFQYRGGKMVAYANGDECAYCEQVCPQKNKEPDGTLDTLKQIAEDAVTAIK